MKKLLFAAPLALAAGALFGSPASAQSWHNNNGGQLRAETITLPDGRSYKRVFPED